MNRPAVPTAVFVGLLAVGLVAGAVFLGGGCPGAVAAGASGKLVVEVSGFRNDQGQLLLRLYDHEDGYPRDGSKAVREIRQRIDGRRAIVTLDALPFGAYAIGCVHDENGNGQLDSNFLGIPREGVCASNDAHGHRGPPRWQDARFDFRADGATVQIHVRY